MNVVYLSVRDRLEFIVFAIFFFHASQRFVQPYIRREMINGHLVQSKSFLSCSWGIVRI